MTKKNIDDTIGRLQVLYDIKILLHYGINSMFFDKDLLKSSILFNISFQQYRKFYVFISQLLNSILKLNIQIFKTFSNNIQ